MLRRLRSTTGDYDVDANLVEIQVVLFTPVLLLRDKARLAVDTNQVASGLFDGDPLLLPIPDDVPPEVPRLILSSKNAQRSLEIAPNRIGLKVVRPPDEATTLRTGQVIDLFGQILAYARQAMRAEPTRLGFVTSWFLDVHPQDPAQLLRMKYLTTRFPVADPAELQIHGLEKRELSGFRVNIWTRIRPGERGRQSGSRRGLVYLFDVNTQADISYDIDDDGARRFFDAATVATDERLAAHLRIASGE